MLTPGLKVKLETVKKLIHRNAKAPLQRLLQKMHPADIAVIIRNLNDLDRNRFWGFVANKRLLADILLETEDEIILDHFKEMEPKLIADVLSEMESDDASYIMRLLPEETSDKVLDFIAKDDLADIEELLHYPEDSAGAVMNTNFVALSDDTTVKDATKLLHKSHDVEMIYYLYVTDAENRLSGVLSLRALIVNPPEKTLGEIMSSEVYSVNVDEDQEIVARTVEKYDLLAVPVVDDQHHLIGIITVDDIIDIIRAEATEDFYLIAGTTDDEMLVGKQAFRIARVRLPWLIITFFGGLLSGAVVKFFGGQVSDLALLAVFMPVIAAMGGNVGSQSATILIRGIALGKIDTKNMISIVFKEIRVGAIMGLVIGLLLAGAATLWQGDPRLGMVVGLSMFSAIVFASFSGTFIPATLIRFNFDPAVASSPFISMLNDISGLAIYFGIAILLLQTLA